MGTEFQKKFIQSHIDDVKRDIPGKPFVLEEFGKIVDKNDPAENVLNAEGGRVTTTRDDYFRAAFEVAEVGGRKGWPGTCAFNDIKFKSSRNSALSHTALHP